MQSDCCRSYCAAVTEGYRVSILGNLGKNFWLVAIGASITVATFAVHLGALPSELLVSGFDADQTGLVLFGFAAGLVCYRGVMLRWVDQIAWRLPMISGASLAALASLAYSFATVEVGFLIARLVHGIGFAAVTTSAMGFIGATVPGELRGRALGYFAACSGFSMMIFPALGIWLSGQMSFSAVAQFGLLLGFLSVTIVSLLPSVSATGGGQAEAVALTTIQKVLLCGALLCSLPRGIFETTIPYIGDARGLASLIAVYVIWGVTTVIGNILGGTVTYRLGSENALVLSLIVAIIGQVSAVLLPNEMGLYLGTGLGGLGLGVIAASANTILSLNTPATAQGKTLGLSAMINNIGIALSSILGGWAFTQHADAPFYLVGVFLLLALILLKSAPLQKVS